MQRCVTKGLQNFLKQTKKNVPECQVPEIEVKQFTGLDTSDMKHTSGNKYVGWCLNYGYYVQTAANKHFSTDTRMIQQVTPSQIFWHVQRRKFTIFLLATLSCNSNNLSTAKQHKSQNSCTENEITFFFFSNCIREPAGSCRGFSGLRRENALFWHHLSLQTNFHTNPLITRLHKETTTKKRSLFFKKQVCKYHMEII